MMISVHLPKTAGVSFSNALEDIFGQALLKDYEDYPINTDPYQRKLAALKASIEYGEIDFAHVPCVHGHFLPLKYLLLAERRKLTFVTWMRHPVQRLLSHYFYWRRSYSPDTAKVLHRRVVEEDWSLEKFCLSPELANLYSQFLWGFPLEMFSFIGITEHYKEDLKFFSNRYLDNDLGYYEENVGDKQREGYLINDDLCEKIELHHKLDMDLYRRALEIRSRRLA
jgi:hypothetical protein